jgi:Effector-associated domain 11
MTKTEFIQTIRQYIANGKTEEALDLLHQHISDYDKSMLNYATLIKSRFQNAHTDSVIKGIVSREDYDLTTRLVNNAVLELLEKIEKDAVINTGVPKDKTSGRILHNIPGTMSLAKETRCIVRIAYDDVTLIRDFKTTADTVIQSVRIAEVMGVELLDFNETPSFQIRTINDAEQFVANDDYTQWLFMVKPLQEGKYPLTLKVAVIEQIDGKERKRDIVLEKDIFIIGQMVAAQSAPAETAPAPAANENMAFEDTNMKLNYAVAEVNKGVIISSPVGKKSAMAGVLSVFGVLVMAMTGLYVYTGSSSNKTDVATTNPMPIDTSNDNPIRLSSKPPLDTAYFKANDNIAEIDTAHIMHGIPTPASMPKKVIVAATPAPAKTTGKVLEKPAKPKRTTTTHQSELAGNTPNIPDIYPPVNASHDESIPQVFSNVGEETKGIKKVVVKNYKVRITLKGEMKEAEILVNGETPLAVKKNIWGTPQYVEFESAFALQTFTFIHNGISCKVENIEIIDEDVLIEACSFNKN